MSGEKCILQEMRETSESIKYGQINPNDPDLRNKALGSPVCAKCGMILKIDSYEGKRDVLAVNIVPESKQNTGGCRQDGGSDFVMNIGSDTVKVMGFFVDDEGF